MSKDLLDIHFAAESRRSADAAICPRGDVCTMKITLGYFALREPAFIFGHSVPSGELRRPKAAMAAFRSESRRKVATYSLAAAPVRGPNLRGLAELIRIHDGDELDLRVQARE
jgi:hypothetical protein